MTRPHEWDDEDTPNFSWRGVGMALVIVAGWFVIITIVPRAMSILKVVVGWMS